MASLKSLGKRKASSESGSEPEEDLLPNFDESSQSDEEDLQQERILEAQLEQDLADELEQDSDSDLSLDGLFEKYGEKPIEEFELVEENHQLKSRLLSFVSRDYAQRKHVTQSRITGQPKFEWQEIDPVYNSESDAEEQETRVGNIPSYFYDDMPHVGYDINGKQVLRPAKGDELDKFLATVDGSAWTSIMDKSTQQNVDLTDAELDLIQRLAKSENPDATFDPYEPTNEWFSRQTLVTPVVDKPEPKRRFLPSKWEHKKVMKIVAAIRAGRIVPNKREEGPQKLPLYNIWSETDQPRADHPMHMPAPKLRPPGHAESYNPPEEYLYSEQEKKEWEQAETSDRILDFQPEKYKALRLVPGYADFVNQRFQRCLDLYLAPRMRKRQTDGPQTLEDLMPQLPSPNELRPYPTASVTTFPHPKATRIRAISIDPTGKWLGTGADDGCVRLWQVETGRCASTWRIGQQDGEISPVTSLEWGPIANRLLLGATTEHKAVLISPLDFLSERDREAVQADVNAAFNESTGADTSIVKWVKGSSSQLEDGILIQINLAATPKQLTWHRKGDYFATVAPKGGSQAICIHQISKHKTQAPFKRLRGDFQAVIFHPSRPHFYVALQREVRIYDLMAQSLVKVLMPGLQMISSLAIHPNGENVIVGSYDKKLAWHDLELSDRPYRVLRHHSRAIRDVSFSPAYPLFFTASDDGSIQVFHATVYSDLVTEPLIVPLKVLRGHIVKDSLGVLQARWHPKEPWIVSAGADGVARLWAPAEL